MTVSPTMLAIMIVLGRSFGKPNGLFDVLLRSASRTHRRMEAHCRIDESNVLFETLTDTLAR